jgi:very-short-patch-repair endonuclease
MPKILPYNPRLLPLAKQLRQNMTYGEVLLWNELKRNKILGFDFDRQCCIDEYIVDFYCKDLMLAIEVDGLSHHHEDAFVKDTHRQQSLESFGIIVIRFTEAEVKYDRQNVLRTTETTIINLVKSNSGLKLPNGFDRKLLED